MSEYPEKAPKLLIVGYYFLRTASSGGHRLHAITKYLTRRGWKVTVLTVARDAPRGKTTDESAVRKYIPPETRVERTRSLEFERLLAYLNKNQSSAGSGVDRGIAADLKAGQSGLKARLRMMARAPGRWLNRILSFPDRQIGWYLPLFFRAWKLVREERIDVVLTSGPPHSCHLPFIPLKRILRFRWVTDFRDPWTNPPFYVVKAASANKRPFSLRLNRSLERRVLRDCDKIIVNTLGNEEALREAFPYIPRAKVQVIPNGIDEEILPNRGSLKDSALECDFVFTGAMYPRMLNVYLDALEVMRLGEQQRIPILHIFGDEEEELTAMVRERGFGRSVVFKGQVPYEESLWLLKNAKALLLLFIGHDELYRRSVPSKLYAYLFSGTPYFALVPEGDAARILDDVGGGVVVRETAPAEVAREMVRFLSRTRAGRLGFERDMDRLRGYAWSELSKDVERQLRGE
jgi:glycosyltransferase involved in cell wall biosynthesis